MHRSKKSYSASEFYERFESGGGRSVSGSPSSPRAQNARNRELFVKYELKRPVAVRGDFRIHFMYQSTPESNWNESSVWWTWLHTSFIDPLETHKMQRPQIDGPHKDHDCQRFAADFGMELEFDPPPGVDESSFDNSRLGLRSFIDPTFNLGARASGQ